MKLNNKQNMKRNSGMTLLELTVVILVLLSLISILFVGATAWKRGADRAGCLMVIRNVQVAIRGWGSMYNVDPGGALSTSSMATDPANLTAAVITGAGNFLSGPPSCPGGGTYTGMLATIVPAPGVAAISCSRSASPYNHVPQVTGEW